jgi:hypothetical protein
MAASDGFWAHRKVPEKSALKARIRRLALGGNCLKGMVEAMLLISTLF